ncbi:unnamed protein product [Parnassius apollo]|uniref:(apollo) hypothetical protein n=1 Tax=Parnassius apollo TaxID=110799 RepID=A0A8S3XFP8_PARAO|nr:unnamed protein product [Parnassius apollo]
MPAHTSHILQPLDVGVFRPLKAAWRAELQNYKVNNPTSVPTRFDFHKFLTPVYEKCFTPTNIRAGFRKAGLYPINKNIVCSEAIAPSILSDQPVPTSQFSMEEIIIGQDYDVDIPQAEIIKTNYDPLSEGAINEKDASKPSIPSISSIAEAQIENSAPSETLQMECELEQVPNSMYNINTVTNNITIDDIPRPILQNKNKIEIHDILILPKWKPNIKTRQKRNVPKAQCLTPVATTSSTNVSLRHVRRTTFKKEDQKVKDRRTPQPNLRKQVKENVKQTSQPLNRLKSSISDDEWVCRSCNGLYSQDVKLQNGADWITCSFCTNPYHIHCQSQIIGDNQEVFMCDSCSIDESSGEE